MVSESLRLVIGIDVVCYYRYAIFQLIIVKMVLLKCGCDGNLLHLQIHDLPPENRSNI